VRPTLVVGIASTANRAREYEPAEVVAALPAALREQLAAENHGPPLADSYLRYLVDELKPFIDGRFRTRPGRDDTFIMGSSMGGLISWYALARYPQVFGGAGCLSTHWPITMNAQAPSAEDGPRAAAIQSAELAWLEQHLPVAGSHRLYFDLGTESNDALYAPYQQRVDELVLAKGYRRWIDFESEVYPGATHDERAWRARLDVPLEFLLRP
jgi:enterochelin esterase-like enzyme